MFSNLSPELIWFMLGFILLLGELVVPAFILLFFGVGAWFTAMTIFMGVAPDINIQLIVFVVTSILALMLFRKKSAFLTKKHPSGKSQNTTHIGSHGIVVEDINPHQFSGKIELNGTRWQAVSEVLITKGTEVEIIDQVNLTLKVKPIH